MDIYAFLDKKTAMRLMCNAHQCRRQLATAFYEDFGGPPMRINEEDAAAAEEYYAQYMDVTPPEIGEECSIDDCETEAEREFFSNFIALSTGRLEFNGRFLLSILLGSGWVLRYGTWQLGGHSQKRLNDGKKPQYSTRTWSANPRNVYTVGEDGPTLQQAKAQIIRFPARVKCPWCEAVNTVDLDHLNYRWPPDDAPLGNVYYVAPPTSVHDTRRDGQFGFHLKS